MTSNAYFPKQGKGGKSKSAGTKKSDLLSPLFEGGDGYELGKHNLEGPIGPKETPDPLGFAHGNMRHGPSAKTQPQRHEKD